MKTLHKLIHAGFAACLLAGASTSALAYAPYPDVALPAPRAGYIWAPAHYEWDGSRMQYYPGVWIQDDYDSQWRMYAYGPNTVIATGPLVLRDRDGNVIPTSPDAYPVESARR